MKKNLSIVGMCALLVFVLACRKQGVKNYSDSISGSAVENAEDINYSGEPSLRWDNARDVNLKIIYFDFDKSSLTNSSMENLRGNSTYLRKNPKMKIVVEGHTDNRGTTEYNLSLGQRRAMQLKEYYIRFGVAADRVATVSYGKENPAELEDNELAWSKNRRAETKVLVKAK